MYVYELAIYCRKLKTASLINTNDKKAIKLNIINFTAATYKIVSLVINRMIT